MSDLTLDLMHDLVQTVTSKPDWRKALNALVPQLRRLLVFDNLAIFCLDEQSDAPEVLYARAVGRGKTAEADASWGLTAASQVIASGKLVLQMPSPGTDPNDRLAQAHRLGLPLTDDRKIIGALVMVRFGGPPFEKDHQHAAELAAMLIGQVLERRRWQVQQARLRAIEQQMELQEDFVANISHELRTPLGFIKGYSTTLLRSDTEWDEATRREFLTYIDEETDRLNELIENVLESARLQSNTLPMNFEPIRLDALLRDSVGRACAHYPGLQAKIDCPALNPIAADSVRMTQVIDNLFSNAVKYAPGSPVTISLRQEDGWQRIRFADRGPGIPAEHAAHIFERFYCVPGVDNLTGTGLGLYICQQIVRAHSGRMQVESTPGEGTTFIIDLPVEKTV